MKYDARAMKAVAAVDQHGKCDALVPAAVVVHLLHKNMLAVVVHLLHENMLAVVAEDE